MRGDNVNVVEEVCCLSEHGLALFGTALSIGVGGVRPLDEM
jgi:hypothetical protein